MDFSKIKTIYMIGIKGVGMTMLAEFLVHHGYTVSGSDVPESFMTDAVLEKAGIAVSTPFQTENIPANVDLIIYSMAYTETTNLEVAAAKEKRLPLVSYAEALGEIFNTHKGVAVAGSHGKTTTTAWLGFVLWQAKSEPNVMVGAKVPQFEAASLTGNSHLLVVEADEYLNKLKYLNPKIILLNNIDYDHPDYFLDHASYEDVFRQFVLKLPKSGILIANADDQAISNIVKDLPCTVITYSLEGRGDYNASDLQYHNQEQFFKVSKRSEEMIENETTDLGNFSIKLLGSHNVSNALAVIATSIELGVSLVDIRRYLGEFLGTARRLEVMGSFHGAVILDDYAHHPTEIKATLAAVRQRYPHEKLRVIFHPHTFTRTKALLQEFGLSFQGADEVIVLDIYGSAREEQGGVTSEEVVEEIKKHSQQSVIHISTLEAVEQYLRETTGEGQVILLMGAGDVFRIGQRLLETKL